MKTAISIEACLLEEADRAARELGVSRSRLVALALADSLRPRVYAEQTGHGPSLAQMKAKFRSMVKDPW